MVMSETFLYNKLNGGFRMPSAATNTHIHQADLPTSLRRETKRYDVVVAGGGMSGIGAAVTAAAIFCTSLP